MKILFLNVDGVLWSLRSIEAREALNVETTIDTLVARVDSLAISLIRLLCRDTGAQIVLSSIWRHRVPLLEVAYALGLPMVGATPSGKAIMKEDVGIYVRIVGDTRGKEIEAWIANHESYGTPRVKYAIVDSEHEEILLTQRSRFVKTDADNGLLLEDYRRLRRLLA